MKKLLEILFIKRGILHFVGSMCLLYIACGWFGWDEYKGEIIAICVASFIIGAIVNRCVEYLQSMYVRKATNQPFVDDWSNTDIWCGAIGASLGGFIQFQNQNLIIAAWIVGIVTAVFEISRILTTKK
jgi:hypothetical protein